MLMWLMNLDFAGGTPSTGGGSSSALLFGRGVIAVGALTVKR